MNYSEKLKKEVKRLYPDWEKANEFAESGNAFLGRYLSDSCNFGIGIRTVLDANSLDELKALASKEKEKIELYNLWREEAKEHGVI